MIILADCTNSVQELPKLSSAVCECLWMRQQILSHCLVIGNSRKGQTEIFPCVHIIERAVVENVIFQKNHHIKLISRQYDHD